MPYAVVEKTSAQDGENDRNRLRSLWEKIFLLSVKAQKILLEKMLRTVLQKGESS